MPARRREERSCCKLVYAKHDYRNLYGRAGGSPAPNANLGLRMNSVAYCIALLLLAGCGALAHPPPTTAPDPSGVWTLHFLGDCAGRESERIQVLSLDDAQMSFADFTLKRDADRVYSGSANFIAPMPVDGRDIVYTVRYSLRRETDGRFSGVQSITESGGHSLPCAVELVAER